MPGESGSTSPELKRRKLRSSLESVSLIPSSLVGASHDISTFFKPKTPEIRRFYKAIGSDPDALTRAEIESANAALLKFYLLGKHTPTKTHSVVRESGEVAVITTEIPGFKPLANMTGTLESIDLISSGLVDIIVTNYVLQGVDPNGFNIGIDANGKAGIVDLA
ncbi:MAG: hypothetical protein JSS53_10660, partial [Proteobacteria bacterium]|nr:hypothetical protein [Pseudomonadota bacterium]